MNPELYRIKSEMLGYGEFAEPNKKSNGTNTVNKTENVWRTDNNSRANLDVSRFLADSEKHLHGYD